MWLFADVLEDSLGIHSRYFHITYSKNFWIKINEFFHYNHKKHSYRVAVNSPKMKFAKLVELILIVKLEKVIDLFVGVKKVGAIIKKKSNFFPIWFFSIFFTIKIILVTHSKDAEENVNLVETVQHNKNVFNLDVLQLVVKEVSISLLDNAPN